ncbi:hypothetical protein [Morganella psychrotolerans]|uniref:Uncharacterized protein n=1 Tax=Morganella psychrotolerans TaxID=368603 RepID=A0A1B8HSE9_9GAMM|nr:hypothetical protein [Morganella psychrotolerans]OBU12525.1 hypothetical protein AYY18_15440 [Morganella psychrotolerans]
MAVAIIFVLICGYYYVDTHIPSRYKLNKATGWNAYFCVGAKGIEFLFFGLGLALVIIFYLYTFMFILNIPYYLGAGYSPFTFASDFLGVRMFGMGMLSILCLGCTAIVSLFRTNEVKNENTDLDKRISGFREIAKDSAVEKILLESLDKMEDGLMLLVSLKSRKVYVGMLDIARFDGLDTNTLVLIPIMSGYRDKDTLTFKVEHYYTEHYAKEGITMTSEPLSVFHFRHVLPFDQIESLSLFNVNTYSKFQDALCEKEKQ